MDKILLPGLGQAHAVSALGFGGASLGSRVGARAGQQLISAALETGITWFDLAPAYGAGQAEEIFAAALKAAGSGARNKVQICTKVGLLPPPQPLWKRLAMPVARPVVRLLAPVRGRIRKSGVTRNRPVPLTPDLLRASLEGSLRRLGTDHIDLYGLHNATPEALADETLWQVLGDLRQSGKIGAVAVASDRAAAEAALTARAAGAPFDVVQCALDQATPDLREQVHHAGVGLITHSIFGLSGLLERAEARLAGDRELQNHHAALGAPDLAHLRLIAARASNPQGVSLCSMMSPARIAANARAFAAPPSEPEVTLAQALFSQTGSER